MSGELKPKVIKEGWLQKKAERIKTWRDRYFVLYNNGTFHGYKSVPQNDRDFSQPENNFTVDRCQILKVNKRDNAAKSNVFVLRGLQHTQVIERKFAAKDETDRSAWIDEINNVAENLKKQRKQTQPRVHSGENSNGRIDMTLDEFEMKKVLGKGTFGKVFLCQEKRSKLFYAIKILKKKVILEKDERDHIITESKVLQMSDHPFLTHLKYAFKTPIYLCFVMEYVNGGELFYHMQRERKFTEDRARFYASEIILALEYLHKQDVVYRDLKLENLLLDREGHIKVADFGLCKEDMTFDAKTDTFCGTPEYLAPEVLDDSLYGVAVDWWGLGVVLYEMMVGRLPFQHTDTSKLFEMILYDVVRFPPFLSTHGKALLNGLLDKDPRRRLGGTCEDAEALKNHQFFGATNWDDVYHKRIQPPWTPELSSDLDTKYIEPQFTSMPITLTPTNEPFEENEETWCGFSYASSRGSIDMISISSRDQPNDSDSNSNIVMVE